jgi:prepilin-type N-terminal cleavage/methylation domain-containing protein/prepilin-type processing-associated H-X9-DG protein
MSDRGRRLPTGFTLIELLIAIGVMAALVALLVPAVMYARAAATRTSCQNNLRQIDLAMQQHVSVKGGFPPLWAYSLYWSGGKQTGSLSNWTPYLLPYLDQSSVADIYALDKMFYENTAAIAIPLKVLQCPAAPHVFDVTTETDWVPSQVSGNTDLVILDPILTAKFSAAVTDYQGFAKVSDDWKELLSYPPNTQTLSGVLADPPYPTPDQIKGWFNGGSVGLQARLRKPADVTDGLSNSILLVEEGGRPQLWENGKLVDATDAIRNSSWPDPAGCGQQLRGDLINQCLVNCNNNKNIYSFHTGGANFPFADGSVRFLSASVSNRTMVSLLTAASDDHPDSDY